MINNKRLSIALIAMIAICIATIFIVFVSWNKPKEITINIDRIKSGEIIGNVDACKISKDYIYVKGWIFPKYKYDGVYKPNTYVVINSTGFFYKINTVRDDSRTDVTSFYSSHNRNYDLTGYMASSRLSVFGLNPSKEIYIVTEFNGITKGMKYVCK